MPTVTYPNGKLKVVKNLHWLIRRRKEVSSIEVFAINESSEKKAYFVAALANGTVYQCLFMSWAICTEFTNEKRFPYAVIRHVKGD